MTVDHALIRSEIEFQEQGDQRRIELTSGAFCQFRKNLIAIHGRSIGPCRAHRIKGICQSDEPSNQWNIFASDSLWVPGSIPTFVVIENTIKNVLEPRNISQNSIPDTGMFTTLQLVSYVPGS